MTYAGGSHGTEVDLGWGSPPTYPSAAPVSVEFAVPPRGSLAFPMLYAGQSLGTEVDSIEVSPPVHPLTASRSPPVPYPMYAGGGLRTEAGSVRDPPPTHHCAAQVFIASTAPPVSPSVPLLMHAGGGYWDRGWLSSGLTCGVPPLSLSGPLWLPTRRALGESRDRG